MSERTTNKDILVLLGEIKGELRQISIQLSDQTDRMNRIDEDIKDVRGEVHDRLSKHSVRLSKIEMRQYALFTSATILATLAGWALRYFL